MVGLARALLFFVVLAAAAHEPAVAQLRSDSRSDRLEEIRQLTLEELMSVDVTSLAGVPQEWFGSPGSMTVLTAEHLRRTGQRTLAEALRLVPGMFVGRQSSNFWRIGARAFTAAALPAPRNLVLIDGRTVYDPLWGGVYWDAQDIPLEHIERIEVIAGPGATLWGHNAVNGVINVITKHAKRSQGLAITAGGGTFERAFGQVSYGTQIRDGQWLRTYVKYAERDAFRSTNGRDPKDDWSMLRAGARMDIAPDASSSLTLDADIYRLPDIGAVRNVAVPGAHLQFQALTGNDDASGGHILLRYDKEFTAVSAIELQTYYDRTSRERLGGFSVSRNTADVDARHSYKWHPRQSFLSGLGYRWTADETAPGGDLLLDPEDQTHEAFSAFVQNTTEILPRRVFAMVGSKLTHHSVSDWQAQPGARLWWTPNSDQIVWAAVSRPVRVPSRVELDGTFPLAYVDPGIFSGGAPTGEYVLLTLRGDPDLNPERLLAYGIGARTRWQERVTLDLTVFQHDYEDLISVPTTQFGQFNNRGTGTSRGVTVAASWRASSMWSIQGGYGFLEVEHEGPVLLFEDRSYPRHVANVRVQTDLMHELELNTVGYYVDEIEIGQVPSYFQLDVGTTWTPLPGWEFAIWGQNVTRPGVRQLGAFEYPRAVYAQGTYRL